MTRAARIGYNITKVVYRGYSAPAALQVGGVCVCVCVCCVGVGVCVGVHVCACVCVSACMASSAVSIMEYSC